MTNVIIAIATSIIGSGALFGLIQYLIDRKDRHSERDAAMMKAIEEVRTDVEILSGQMAQERAITARVRILRCSDEMRHKQRHSEEYFDQMLEDINNYETYCVKNPDFKNSKAELAIENIKRVYANCLQQGDFL